MSARQDVFNYLKDHPKATLKDVLAALPKLKETTVKRYFFENRKLKKNSDKDIKKEGVRPKRKSDNKISKKTATSTSIRQKVFDFLQNNPDASLEQLTTAFSKSKKGTLSNYRSQWKKEKSSTEDQFVNTTVIFEFLDQHPTSNLNDLREVFPEAGNKLITIFRSWKNKQKGSSPTSSKSSVAEEKSPLPESNKENYQDEYEKQQKTIEKHKEIIDKQKEIIEKQKTRIELLKSRQPKSVKTGVAETIKNFIRNKILKS